MKSTIEKLREIQDRLESDYEAFVAIDDAVSDLKKYERMKEPEELIFHGDQEHIDLMKKKLKDVCKENHVKNDSITFEETKNSSGDPFITFKIERTELWFLYNWFYSVGYETDREED